MTDAAEYPTPPEDITTSSVASSSRPSSSSSGRTRRTRARAHPNADAVSKNDPASATGGTPAPSPVTRTMRADVDLNGDAATLEKTIITLNAAIDQLERDGALLEQYEALREKTPLALRLEVVSCRLASEVWHRDRTFPDFTFPTDPCIRGKDRPDQDCRTCVNCLLIPWGHKHMGSHEVRYPGHGVVFPIADENDAVRVAAALSTLNLAHLRRPTHELIALRRARDTASVNLETARKEAQNPSKNARG